MQHAAHAALATDVSSKGEQWCMFDNTTLGAATGNALDLARWSLPVAHLDRVRRADANALARVLRAADHNSSIHRGNMRTSRKALLLAALVVIASCRHGDEEPKVPVSVSRATDTTAARPLAAGDIRIASVDGSIDLAMIGDSISGGLSLATLAKVRQKTDTGAVTGTGFGASIEKMVKASVRSAIGTRMGVPVSSVKDVRYDGKRIVFDWNGKAPTDFANAKVNNKDVMASFGADDAQRFVDAVHARKRALGQM